MDGEGGALFRDLLPGQYELSFWMSALDESRRVLFTAAISIAGGLVSQPQELQAIALAKIPSVHVVTLRNSYGEMLSHDLLEPLDFYVLHSDTGQLIARHRLPLHGPLRIPSLPGEAFDLSVDSPRYVGLLRLRTRAGVQHHDWVVEEGRSLQVELRGRAARERFFGGGRAERPLLPTGLLILGPLDRALDAEDPAWQIALRESWARHMQSAQEERWVLLDRWFQRGFSEEDMTRTLAKVGSGHYGLAMVRIDAEGQPQEVAPLGGWSLAPGGPPAPPVSLRWPERWQPWPR